MTNEMGNRRVDKKSVYDVDFDYYINNATPAYIDFMNSEHDYLRNSISRGRLLELGAGSGRILKAVHDIVDSAVGVDKSKTQISALKRNVPHGNIGVVHADMRDLPFKEGYFGYATLMFSTLRNFHDEDKVKILSEARRILKKGGKLFVSVYAENAFDYQREFYTGLGFDVRNEGSLTIVSGENGGFVSERFTREKLEQLARSAGFSEVRITPLTEWTYMCEMVK